MRMALIGDFLHIESFFLADHQGQWILFAVDKYPTFRCLIGKQIKLTNVFFLVGKNVRVVPCNSGDQTYMMLVAQKFWSWVQCRRQILVTFNDNYRRILGKLHCIFDAANTSSDHVIEAAFAMREYVYDDRGDGGLAVTAGDHNTLFIFRVLIYILRERING